MNKSTINDIKLAAIVVFMVIMVISILAYFFDMPKAEAVDWPFPEPPYIYVGISNEMNETFCHKSQGNVVGDIGFGQILWQSRNRRWEAPIEYSHNSCAFTDDRESYDAIGIKLQWSPWR